MPALTAAAVACLGFWVLGWLALNSGHPNEDAYILFKYVDNLVAGHGIVFYAGGPPTAGATDFLWLLLLSLAAWLGADVAVAAVLWNGLGAGLAAGILGAVLAQVPVEVGARRRSGWTWLWSLTASLFVLTFHGAIAAVSGFSSMAFSAVMLAGCMLVWRGGSLWLPALGLALALFRPEGVVTGVAFVFVGWFQVRRQKTTRHNRYLIVAACCLVMGVAYLAWHRAYFGLWLPLSVYAKSGGLLPGLSDNLTWIRREIGPLPFLVVSGWVLLRHRLPKTMVLRCLWALLPVLALLLPLAFAVQTQNVRWRFQAPITLAIAWWTLVLLAAAAGSASKAVSDPARRTWVVATILMVLAMAPSWVVGVRRTAQLISHPNPRIEYTAAFAPRLGDLLSDDDTILLTEAGILAYWSHCRIVDVVGLNDARAAKDGMSMQDVVDDTKRPAVVMFNAYEVLDLKALDPKVTGAKVTGAKVTGAKATGAKATGAKVTGAKVPGSGDGNPLVPIDRDHLARAIRAPTPSLDRARRAARTLAVFLASNEGYYLCVVLLGRNNHVYGFRKDHPQADLMLTALAECCAREQQPSYMEVKGVLR